MSAVSLPKEVQKSVTPVRFCTDSNHRYRYVTASVPADKWAENRNMLALVNLVGEHAEDLPESQNVQECTDK